MELNAWRESIENNILGFVPTMGALHEGHLSLVRKSQQSAACTLVSIYVNPTQFNNASDLDAYPNTLDEDLRALDGLGVDAVYLPVQAELYPDGPKSRSFEFGSLALFMEGQGRPGHFEGMATVVTRFFEIIKPQQAFFGEKDYQQLAIIKHVVEAEQWPVEIVPCETGRESDGLAMSSRNLRLNEEERKSAAKIYSIISETIGALDWEATSPSTVTARLVREINEVAHLKVEYVAFSNAKTLVPVTDFSNRSETRIFAAVYCGNVRLIDNLPLF